MKPTCEECQFLDDLDYSDERISERIRRNRCFLYLLRTMLVHCLLLTFAGLLALKSNRLNTMFDIVDNVTSGSFLSCVLALGYTNDLADIFDHK